MRKRKQLNPIPEEFASYEEAAEFWDTHDTTDYPEAFRSVKVESELRQRHYELEIDADVAQELSAEAHRKGISPGRLASSILRQRLAPDK